MYLAKKIENHDPAIRLRYFGSTNLDLLFWPQSPIFQLLKPTQDRQKIMISLADGFSFDVTFERVPVIRVYAEGQLALAQSRASGRVAFSSS